MTSTLLPKTKGVAWISASILAQTTAMVCSKLSGISTIPGQLVTLLASPWYWASLAGLSVQTICWILALKLLDLSVAHPLSSLVFVTNLICAACFFDEKVANSHVIGIVFIMTGASLVGQTSK